MRDGRICQASFDEEDGERFSVHADVRQESSVGVALSESQELDSIRSLDLGASEVSGAARPWLLGPLKPWRRALGCVSSQESNQLPLWSAVGVSVEDL